VDRIGEARIEVWIRSFFCGDRHELGMQRINLVFYFGALGFVSGNYWSSSHNHMGLKKFLRARRN